MFSTLNESSLHKSLKIFYANRYGGKTEAQVEKWICDIVCEDETIIEIQTKSVSSLHEKVARLLALGKKVVIVHPITTRKTIRTFNPSGEEISAKKSPKRESVYSMLRELTGLCDILLHENFSLVCPLITAEEKRVRSEEPVQSKNGRRRFKKAWLKTDKSLLTLDGEITFRTKDEYLALLPRSLPEEFSSAELSCALEKEGKPYANLILWILHKMDLIERTGKKDKRFYYKKNSATNAAPF